MANPDGKSPIPVGASAREALALPFEYFERFVRLATVPLLITAAAQFAGGFPRHADSTRILLSFVVADILDSCHPAFRWLGPSRSIRKQRDQRQLVVQLRRT